MIGYCTNFENDAIVQPSGNQCNDFRSGTEREKREPLLKNVGLTEVLLYPCLRYSYRIVKEGIAVYIYIVKCAIY